MKIEYSTLPDAIEYLIENTGRKWTIQDLLKLAIYNFPLNAKPDKVSPVKIQLFDSSSNLVSTQYINWSIAILNGEQMEQLLKIGTTSAKFADGNDQIIFAKLPEQDDPYDLDEMEYLQKCELAPPIIVNIDMTIVSNEIIEKIVYGKIAWPIYLPPSEKTDSNPKKHVFKQILQENEILDCLKKLDYKPEALPKQASGKAGVKGEVRELLLQNTQLFTISSFNKAWERLRAEGKLKEAN